MIHAILDRLKKDKLLSALLGATKKDSRIYPIETDSFGPCITYSVSPVIGGGVKTDRVKLSIYDLEYDRLLCIVAKLMELLDLEECDPGWLFSYEDDTGALKRVEIFTSGQNGGGELVFDVGEQQLYQKILFFNIKWRYVK